MTRRRPPLFPDFPPFPRILPRWSHATHLVLGVALLVRIAAAMAMSHQLQTDPDAYARLAENLNQYGVLGHIDPPEVEGGHPQRRPSAYRPPLYPIVLSITCVDRNGRLQPVRVAVLHVVMGVATTLFVWHLALVCGLGGWSMAAAAATLLDPLLLNQASLVMTETMAALMVVASLWFLMQRRTDKVRYDVAAGISLGLAALCRPTFLAWIALVLLVEGARHLTIDKREALGRTMVMSFFVLLTVSPWMLRNARQFGRPTPTTTHGGYTLLLGNNPGFYQHLREQPFGSTWDADELGQEQAKWLREHQMDELAADRNSYDIAWNTILEQPGTFLYSCVVRLGRFWSPLPHKLGENESTKRRALRWMTCLWYDAVLVLMLVGITAVGRHRLPGPWLEGYLLTLSLTVVHLFFWSNMRMRAPLVPFLSLLVAAGLVLICSREDQFDPEQLESDDTQTKREPAEMGSVDDELTPDESTDPPAVDIDTTIDLD